MRLKSKVAIVTGAASGIGKAIAEAMSREGASVVIADINKEGAEKVARDISKSGGRALAVKTDISKEDEVEQMVKRTITEFGRVDILVNNAAFEGSLLSSKSFAETEAAEWKRDINVTFIGTLLCCKAVIPHMLKQKSGSIINVCSDAGKMGIPQMTLYSACKAAVAGFSRAFAQEIATQGITVNCVSPGPIRTEGVARVLAGLPPETQEAWVSNVPMRRFGEPAEIASMIVFLASDEAKYITGQDYSVDGGARM